VTRIIWLASYPKSGNTWLRLLIANALAKDGQSIDINKVPYGGTPSARPGFDYVTLIDSGLLTYDEVDDLRPRAYAALTRSLDDESSISPAAPAVEFLKVHHAYTMNSAGEPVLGGAGSADGAVLIVRDPRDVAPSLAQHMDWRIDDTITFMNDDDAALSKKTNRQHIQLRQKLRDWSGHAASWLDQRDIPVHLIRYEDLRKDAKAALGLALDFAGLPVGNEQIDRAVARCDFGLLRDQEERTGFREVLRPGIKFFRRGEAGAWRDELSRQQIQRIETRHRRMMLRLGYELSYASDLARTG
jgi:sulfotransferase family protein